MPRIGSFALCCVSFFLLTSVLSAQAEKTAIEQLLEVRKAMVEAENHLLQGQAEKAVAVLENKLPLIEGNRRYLDLLRDAYRSHITNLFLAEQKEQAQVYLRRLRIIAPQLADDLARQPGSAPTTAGNGSPQPATPTAPAKPALKARGVAGESLDDPFALTRQLQLPAGGVAPLVAQAEARFKEARYAEAGTLFQQAYQQDRTAIEASRERWAYCKLHLVAEQLKNPNLGPNECQTLEQEVRAALVLAPRLNATSQPLLEQLAQRQQPGGGLVLEVSVQHLPAKAQGWQVAETTHFRIFHNQQRDLVEQTARAAERTRADVLKKWFAGKSESWRSKCDIYLHASATDYSKATLVPGSTPGHSRLESDRRSGVVTLRRMELRCDNPDLVAVALPHETTHVTVAGQFGAHLVPRWVDEGVAVLSEPPANLDLHRRNLARIHQQRELFPVKQLMELDDFPSSKHLVTFYAQSISLVEYLVSLRGPVAFSVFVRDGLQQGYEASLKRHYQINDYTDLHNRFQQHVQASIDRQSPAFAEK